MCRTSRYLAEMVDNKNADESVNLFCSSSCVMAFKVQTVSASGTGQVNVVGAVEKKSIPVSRASQCIFLFCLTGARLNCDSCGKFAVPAYHLAMSDTSIRNFCTLPCVMAFQVTRVAVVAFVPLYQSWKCERRLFGCHRRSSKTTRNKVIVLQSCPLDPARAKTWHPPSPSEG